jgi:hypothetical protein
MSDVWFQQSRAIFAKDCIDKQLYYTLCLVGASEVKLNASIPALAAMANVHGKIQIMFHPDVEALAANSNAFNFLMFHEIRHITQAASLMSAVELPDLSPLVRKGQEMAAQCDDANKKAAWLQWVEQLADRKHPVTYKILQTACNIGMDAAVNRDCILIWGDQARRDIEVFLYSRLTEEQRAKAGEEKTSLVTVSLMEMMCNKKLEPNAEWLYYTNEYLLMMSERITDPSNEPVSIGIPCDDHGEQGGQSQSEEEQSAAQHACKDACSRAQDEAKFMAEKAGKGVGDSQFMSGLVRIDRRIKRLLDAMRFRLKKIFHPSPEEQYTFTKDNRLWPNRGLPGTENIMKPKASVALVIDVSGSCWRADWLNQMVAAAKHLHKKGQLAGMWSFDTSLDFLPFDGNNPIAMRGGGGTVWRPEFTDEILKTLKCKKVDIVLLSDMEISGLDELSADNRVKLHKIKIDDYLKGGL